VLRFLDMKDKVEKRVLMLSLAWRSSHVMFGRSMAAHH
jgi:hypothetical protein